MTTPTDALRLEQYQRQRRNKDKSGFFTLMFVYVTVSPWFPPSQGKCFSIYGWICALCEN